MLHLQGDKITLRPMRRDETGTFFRWATDSDGAKFWYGELCGEKVPSYEEFLHDWKSHYFDGSQPEKGRCFVIELDGQSIGEINYCEIKRPVNLVDIDIIIPDEADTGNGYGPDAMNTLMKYLQEEFNITKFRLEVAALNDRAIRVYEKLGFTEARRFVKNGAELLWMEKEVTQ